MNQESIGFYYLAVFLGGLIGIALHIMGRVKNLRVKFPSNTPKQIFYLFLNEDWNVLIVSAIVNLSCLISVYFGGAHYLGLDEYGFGPLIAFVGMIGIGYFGQRIVYTWLGTTERALNKKLGNNE